MTQSCEWAAKVEHRRADSRSLQKFRGFLFARVPNEPCRRIITQHEEPVRLGGHDVSEGSHYGWQLAEVRPTEARNPVVRMGVCMECRSAKR